MHKGVSSLKAEASHQPDIRTHLPEAHLWFAVLCLALRDAAKHPGSPVSLRARRWFGERRRGVGSFSWICDVLGINCREELLRIAYNGTKDDHEKLQKILFRNK